VVGAGVGADGLATAVRRAVAGHAGVINLSLSTTVDDPDLRKAVADAIAADVVVVAAVGNNHDRGDPVPYPAAYPGVLGVGAIDAAGHRVDTSQVGPYVGIVAPGAEVTGAQPGGGHAPMSGTSLAAPFVAATAALLRQYRPDLDAAAVVRRLRATADPSPGGRPSKDYGSGVLNPLRALTDVLPAGPAPTGVGAPALGHPPAPRHGGPPLWAALGVGGLLVTIGVLVALAAAAVPSGRRRRWRPGALP
jgi:subtilisin family serine protease